MHVLTTCLAALVFYEYAVTFHSEATMVWRKGLRGVGRELIYHFPLASRGNDTSFN